MEKLFLFDTSNLVYRSFFAFSGKHLINSKGQITSGIYGTLRTVLSLYREFGFDFSVFAIDASREETHRFKKFPFYKSTREKQPDALKDQFRKVFQLFKMAGIECFSTRGFESDDIIASLTNKFLDRYEIYIVSGDKDLLQLLVNENVKIISFSPQRSDYKVITRSSFIDEYGFEPEYIVDYLSIVGDSIDDIPGVKGIGEKTALPLVRKYKTLENIYSHLDELPVNIKNKFVEQKEMAFLSKELVKLIVDPGLNVELVPFSIENFKRLEVLEFLKELEFKSILKELGVYQDRKDHEVSLFDLGKNDTFTVSSVKGLEDIKTSQPEYRLITTKQSIYELIQQIKSIGLVAIDVETEEEHFMKSNLLGISFCFREREAYYLPIFHPVEKDFSHHEALESIKEVLEDDRIKKIGHNIKFDLIILKRYGIDMKGIYFDTMVASYVIKPEFTHHNLDRLAEEYLNYKTITYEEVTKKRISPSNTLLSVSIDSVKDYSCEDADITYRLFKLFSERIEKDEKLRDLFFFIEMPLVEVLVEMEYNGIRIDIDYLKLLSRDLDQKINELTKKIFDIVGQVFNLNSPKQLSYVLFEKLKLKPVKKTKTGFSTDEKVLEELEDQHEVVKCLLEYRTLYKLKTTYVDELPRMVVSHTGRIHTSFNQTVTATGRLSSSNPNLQNIPIREEIGRNIRKAFIPGEGKLLGSFDYSQIELRVLAHISGDEVLIQRFLEGEDIHTSIASEIFRVRPEEVTPEMRRVGKTVNFGIVYGISAYGLSEQLKISVSEASEIISRYFSTFKGVYEYILNTLEFVSSNGYVETIFGRKRYIPELLNKKHFGNKLNLQKPERIAINTPIQGSASDIVKIAMIRLFERLRKENSRTKLLIQVHDEIVVETPLEDIENDGKMIKDTMENSVSLKVPLVVDFKYGINWGEIH